jgi:hypothetical protein
LGWAQSLRAGTCIARFVSLRGDGSLARFSPRMPGVARLRRTDAAVRMRSFAEGRREHVGAI